MTIEAVCFRVHQSDADVPYLVRGSYIQDLDFQLLE
jgi:hypothetical protein